MKVCEQILCQLAAQKKIEDDHKYLTLCPRSIRLAWQEKWILQTCYQWKDSLLSNLKESYFMQTAKFAITYGIDLKPGFN